MTVDTTKGGIQVAQKTQTLFIDDIDGGAAEGTVRFALDGTEYEIDLNASALAPGIAPLRPQRRHQVRSRQDIRLNGTRDHGRIRRHRICPPRRQPHYIPAWNPVEHPVHIPGPTPLYELELPPRP